MTEMVSGRIPHARYIDPGLPEYRDNPLISALPPILDAKQVVAQLRLKPIFDKTEANLDGRLRVHAIARLLNHFFQPLTHHLELEQKISLILRQGYLSRNPAQGSYHLHLQNGYKRVQDEDLEAVAFEQARSSANSLSLFGCSGCGKSETINRIFSLYDQAIFHPEYNITQLTYLKVECPGDGDLDELCLSFFNEVDRVLHTQYSISHGRKKLGTKRLMASMAQIANLHALGVLVIDEVQNLNEAKSGGAEKMHNFFVSLVNTIGVPVVQVGTHRARKFFQRTFRAARRISGFGSLLWDRLPNDRQWYQFLNLLWQYQWLQRAEPLNDVLAETIYDLTQGVMDIVVKLYVLAQVRAIVTGTERITPELLRQVYLDEFKPVHPMLAALRSNNPQLLEAYDDLLMPDIEARMLSLVASIEQGRPEIDRPVVVTDKSTKLLALLLQLEIPEDIAGPLVDRVMQLHPDLPVAALVHKATEYTAPVSNEPAKVTRVKRTEWLQLPSNDLRYLYASSEKDNIYQTLKNLGLIYDLRASRIKAG